MAPINPKTPQDKASIVNAVTELLERPDCIVRIQRELQRQQDGSFVTGRKVMIVIVATKEK